MTTRRQRIQQLVGRIEASIAERNRERVNCDQCGGTGVVANMRAINRTGDPHINRKCRHCRGTGKR